MSACNAVGAVTYHKLLHSIHAIKVKFQYVFNTSQQCTDMDEYGILPLFLYSLVLKMLITEG